MWLLRCEKWRREERRRERTGSSTATSVRRPPMPSPMPSPLRPRHRLCHRLRHRPRHRPRHRHHPCHRPRHQQTIIVNVCFPVNGRTLHERCPQPALKIIYVLDTKKQGNVQRWVLNSRNFAMRARRGVQPSAGGWGQGGRGGESCVLRGRG